MNIMQQILLEVRKQRSLEHKTKPHMFLVSKLQFIKFDEKSTYNSIIHNREKNNGAKTSVHF